MSEQSGRTPVIIGVGQFSERVTDDGYQALSPMDVAGEALKAAIADAGASGDLATAIDTIGAIRQFEISHPKAVAPFGKSNNPPRSIGKRAGADPKRAILDVTGGQGNQKLLGEFAADIAKGDSDVAVVVGSEAISTTLALVKQGQSPDWSEDVDGELEDRGYAVEGMFDRELVIHGAANAIPLYAMFDQARRRQLGVSPQEYREKIGELFEPFTQVAAANPHAAAPTHRSAAELAQVTERNRIVAEPYTRMTVARDQVNQGAAIIIASIDKARELGVPDSQWVHLHAVTSKAELPIMARPDLAKSPASIDSIEAALATAGIGFDALSHIDLYSCFAIPVFNVIDHFGVAPDDPRGLTLTGGLPFFGGAGNNYSAHAIAEAVQKCRAQPGSWALTGANGGAMSKYATGIYSTTPADWSDAARVQVLENTETPIPLAAETPAEAVIESFTVIPSNKGVTAVVIARSDTGERAAANADLEDAATAAAFENDTVFGSRVALEPLDKGRAIARILP